MRLAAIILAIAISGCAGTTVRQIAYGPAGDKAPESYSEDEAKGIRYYEGAWFIIVYSDGKGGLKSEAKFLPDLRRKLSVDPYSILAKNETTLSFSNGILTQGKSVVDEATIPKTVLAGLEKAALAQIAAFNQAEKDDGPSLPLPVIYRVDVNASGSLVLIEGKTKVTKQGEPQYINVTPQPADGATP